MAATNAHHPQAGPRTFRVRTACSAILVLAGVLFLSFRAALAQMQVKGSAKFGVQITNALVLLQTKAPDAYRIVTNQIGIIQQGQHSGMWANRVPPVFEVADPTTFHSVTWCAGCIAHDSIHSKLYHDWQKTNSDPVPDTVWTGETAEKQCLEHQVQVLKLIGAPTNEIVFCSRVKPDFYEVNHHPTNTWDDYKKRNW